MESDVARAPKRARDEGGAGAASWDAWRALPPAAAAVAGASALPCAVSEAVASEEAREGAAGARAPEDAPSGYNERQIAAVRAYHAATGRWPSSAAPGNDVLELVRADGGVDVLSVSLLGKWLVRCKRDNRMGVPLHPAVRAFAAGLGWPEPSEATVRDAARTAASTAAHMDTMLAAVRAYRAAKGYWPSAVQSDKVFKRVRADGGVDVFSVCALGKWLSLRKTDNKQGTLKHPAVVAFAAAQRWAGPDDL